ncbi:MAG: hypothetical protein WCT10_03965 [Patescibacteria group bacterium]|jgi:hypothetical protein
MSRTPELRQYLSGEQRPEEVRESTQSRIADAKKYSSDPERPEKLAARYEAEKWLMADLEDQAKALRTEAPDLSDEEFDRRSDEIERAVAEMHERICSDEVMEKEKYATGFTDWKEVNGLGDFLDKFPMYWIPTKEEVGRVLATAKIMHEQRVAAGVRRPEDPLEILDIGGANGALGKLIVDLARENGLKVEYSVVDPFTEGVDAARQAYAGDKELEFTALSSSEFIAKEYAGDAEIGPLVAEREKLLAAANRQRQDLVTLTNAVSRLKKAGRLDPPELARLHRVLRTDFGMQLSAAAGSDPERFAFELESGWDEKTMTDAPSAADRLTNDLNSRPSEISRRIESLLAGRPASRDLVINSWMPPGRDFTSDIRAANGAAVMYFVETYGATGVQEQAGYPSRPSRIGEEDSYGPGVLYNEDTAWVGRSAPELANRHRDSSSWGRNEEFCNAALVQVRREMRLAGRLKLDPASNGIRIEGQYPWEGELREKHGGVSPTAPIVEKQGRSRSDYHSTLNELVSEMTDLLGTIPGLK